MAPPSVAAARPNPTSAVKPLIGFGRSLLHALLPALLPRPGLAELADVEGTAPHGRADCGEARKERRAERVAAREQCERRVG